MPEVVAVAPVYDTGDLARILETEQRQIEDTVAGMTEEQIRWKPHARARSALDILWHLAYLRQVMGLDEPSYYHEE